MALISGHGSNICSQSSQASSIAQKLEVRLSTSAISLAENKSPFNRGYLGDLDRLFVDGAGLPRKSGHIQLLCNS